MNTPETRSSLLLRIRNRDDREGWGEFAEIYRPVICRMARYKGMQQADAEDLSQQVLFAISKAIDAAMSGILHDRHSESSGRLLWK